MQGRQLELGVPRTTEADLRRAADEVRAEWQRAQRFPICPEGDPRKCNVYRDLRFPDDVYEHIEEFWEGGDDVRVNDRRRRE